MGMKQLTAERMERCVLCLRADRPMTREHVFARWLVQQVRGGRLLPSDVPRDPPPLSTSMRISRVVAAVCADCNAGWMSTLEVSFRRMIFGRPRVGVIPAPDRLTLSRWATKTAVLLASARGRVLLDDAHRAQLVAGMPDGVEVFLARLRRPRQHLDFAFAADADRDAAVRSVAILVDDLIAQVAQRGARSGRYGTRLWPLRTHTIRWDTLPVISTAK